MLQIVMLFDVRMVATLTISFVCMWCLRFIVSIYLFFIVVDWMLTG